jgi:hypothetical protein
MSQQMLQIYVTDARDSVETELLFLICTAQGTSLIAKMFLQKCYMCMYNIALNGKTRVEFALSEPFPCWDADLEHHMLLTHIVWILMYGVTSLRDCRIGARVKECRETLFEHAPTFEDKYQSSVFRFYVLIVYIRYTRNSVSHGTPSHVWPVTVNACVCVSECVFTLLFILH